LKARIAIRRTLQATFAAEAAPVLEFEVPGIAGQIHFNAAPFHDKLVTC